jgi:hypothetical protein
MPTSEVIFRETRRFEGVDYEITVHTTGSGYYGMWQCEACGMADVDILISITVEDAIASAREGATGHHRSWHRPTTQQRR